MKILYSFTKRTSLLLVGIFLASGFLFKTSAQAITEGFDDITTLGASGWNMQNLSNPVGTTNWFQGNATVFSAFTGATTSYIGANFNNTGSIGTISNWLISPNRTFNNGDVITFYTRKADPDLYPDRLQVRMSLNGASTNVGATANSVGDFTTLLLDINSTLITGVYPIVWTQYVINIQGLGGPTSGRIAFRYFVTNGGLNGANSDYIGIDDFHYLINSACSVPAAVGAIPENETCSLDANGGCNSTPAVYQDISCGTTVRGTSWYDGTTRDTDWFRFAVAASTTATITATAEFPFQLFFIDITTCPGTIIGAGATGNTCQTITYSEALTPGTYVAFIAPQFTSPIINCAYALGKNYNFALNMTVTTPTVTPSGATTFCSGGSVTLTSSAASSYLWSNSATTQAINVTSTGSYTVTTTNVNGCTATSAPVAVTVNASPTASITGINAICSGNSSTLNSNATAGSGNITGYQWQLNTVDISGAISSTYNATAAGNYTVVVTNSNGCSTTSAIFALSIANNPTASITGNTTACDNSLLTSNATAGSGSITGYQWQESNVNINGATSSTYNATASGSYTVIVTNSFGCTVVSAPFVISVNASPTVSISGINYACAGNSSTLTANATAGSGNITGYQWQESNVDIAGETNSTYNATSAGSYTVIVTNSNGCSTTSISFSFTIANLPTVTINGNSSMCSGDVNTLTSTATAGSGSISGYQWQESNVSIGGATLSSYTVTASGSYTLIVTNTFGCTAASSPLVVTVNASPTVSISGNSSSCSGNPATLTANATAGSGNITGYQWQESSVDIAGETNSTYSASSAGVYTVVVTNSNGCSTTSAPFTFTIGTNPSVTTTGNTTMCVGDNNPLSSSATAGCGTITGYQWQESNVDISGATSSTYNPTASGSYTVVVTNSCGCTAASTPIVVSANAAPTVSITGVNYTCSGNFTTLSANATAGSGSITGYQWQESSVDIAGETNSTYDASAAGTYTVIVTNSNGCTTVSAPFTFTVANHPTVSVTANSPFCEGDTLAANATAGSGSISGYQWQESNVDISGATNSTYNPTASGSYTVIVTNTFGCTEVSTPVSVTVLPLPTAANTFTTVGDQAFFTNTSADALTYSWDFGDGSPIDNSTSPSHLYAADGTYIVTLIACNNCGCDTVIDTVIVSTTFIGSIDNSNGLHIYPNPVNETLNIDFSSASSQSFEINIFNSLGQVVYSEMIQHASGKVHSSVDVSDFARGCYTLQLKGNASVVRSKFIVQ